MYSHPENIKAQREGYYKLQEELRIQREEREAREAIEKEAKEAELKEELNSLTFQEDDLVPIVGNPKIGENYYFKLKNDNNIYYGKMSNTYWGSYGFKPYYGKDKQLIETDSYVAPGDIYEPKNKTTGGKNRTKNRSKKNRSKKNRTKKNRTKKNKNRKNRSKKNRSKK
jgi:hypothetical protein